MSEQYEGDPDNYPDDFTLADDAAPPTAAVTNVGLEALGDRTAWLRQRLPTFFQVECTSAGAGFPTSVTAPTGATHALVEIVGGGGGGGGGANFQAGDTHSAGGGGGGGAMLVVQIVPVVGDREYLVFVGVGGDGGLPGSPADPGDPGGDSLVFDTVTELTIAHAMGGQGGAGGRGCTTGSGANTVIWGLGGGPCGARDVVPSMETTLANGADLYRDMTPQRGGNGVTGNNGGYKQYGNDSPQYFTGGEPGTPDTSVSGSYKGGGCGGGGGAGPYGNGGDGGDGGAPNNAGPAVGGGDGGIPAANTGGGGGGGGASGGSATAGTGGIGGKGGSGRVRITWLKRGLV